MRKEVNLPPMIKAVREVTIKPVPDNHNGAHVPSETLLIIAITDKSEHYHLFDNLLESLKVEVEEKVTHG